MPIVTKVKGFKPEFGNQDHIRILEELKLLNIDIKRRDELTRLRKESAVLPVKIAERKRKIRKMIDFLKFKKNA